jgi:gamma-glutamyltranspeptidase/glutathione hydrolase
VPEVIAGYWRAGEPKLSRHPESIAVYLPHGRPPRAGTLFKNPALASTYRLIAEGGRDAFYKGEVADKLVAFSEKNRGLFTRKDFEDDAPTWVDPVSTNYRGYDVWELPPNGQGIAVLQMLNVLEGYDLAKYGPGSADYWHLFLEAKKLAYADRARFYADPDFAKVPVAELISKPYAAERRKRIDMAHALTNVEAGDPKLGRSETIMLVTADKDRNCVSLIQSNYNGFGSGLAPADLGFAIQNRGCLFSLDPAHLNTLEPHKRPFHTIIPGFVTKDGKPWLTFGVMGGDMQPQGQVEVLCNLIDFHLDVQRAGEYPRLEHVGHPTPTGRPGAADGGTVQAEPGVPQSVVDDLTKRGHHVVRVRRNGGGYQAIRIDWDNGVLIGGSEARKDGVAAGY